MKPTRPRWIDIKGITIYRGNDVVVVQGSIRMTGHTMTVYNDDNGETELVIMQGDAGNLSTTA